MSQIIHSWSPHKELTHYISLNHLRQDPDKLQLSFTLSKKISYSGAEFDNKVVIFTFENPFAVRYSDEGHRVDLIEAKFVDDANKAVGGNLAIF
ncbi:hypothetical protein [Halobacillus salinus]|uniref:hypothetical protein n=1 Tax=Halobacillus salinus TaxID=192814 RepID=UPI0009A89A3E|nr:hypothetical protein [Halobacillus salinus]